TTSEKRNPYNAGHQKRVAVLASAIAQELGLSESDCEDIFTAAILHDIGKMQISSEIMSKPGKLGHIEKLFIKSHPQASYEIVKTIPFAPQIAKAILQHHERMDGSGYPLGVAGEEIIFEARILAVADVVEAMSSHRPYRPALGVNVAMDEITRYSGILYDADVVKACLRLFNSGKINFL
ncbi:MAG: HD-GYP domain-containing protein, partial [Syntrophomonadaceae bacterium]|nr:HD-GYP domain-containing protein [Syntrophomonadaceae bacterium]